MTRFSSAHTRQSFQPRRAKRMTGWLSMERTETVTIGAASVGFMLGSFSAVQLTTVSPGTLVRIRGRLYAESDQTAASENAFGAFGIAVVTDAARAIGVTAVPTPWDDATEDVWLYHTFFDTKFNIVAENSVGYVFNIDVDAKAMRKVNDAEAIIVMAELGGSGGASLNWNGRFLFMLH